jgi:histidine triad (HIT) family protein
MPDCLFCRIARKEIPARIVDEDADTLTFEDIEPQAPVHLLVIPRRHIATGNEVTEGDDALLGKLLRAAARAARVMGFAGNGWRAVLNVGRDAHQLVFHVHLHVLAGRHMGWPPG